MTILGLLLFAPGCSDKIKYSAGFVTTSVKGKIELAQNAEPDRVFIVVRKYHRTLLESSGGYLHRLSASIVHLDDRGYYKIPLDSEVDRIDLLIVAEGYRSGQQSFRRTLGIGSYQYDTMLEMDPNWHNNYYLLIKPMLSEYITEERFRMDTSDQMFLGNWFSEVEAEF